MPDTIRSCISDSEFGDSLVFDWRKAKFMLQYISRVKFTLIFSMMVVSAFIGYLFSADSVFSERENRFLTARPAITLSGLADGDFMDRFELYTTERLPLRDVFVSLKAAFGEMIVKNENNGIVRGRDGYLFEKLVAPDPQLEKNRASVLNMVKQTDREITVCIIPNSFEILKDKLPAGFPNISEEDFIRSFYDELGECGNVHTIDMYEALRGHEDEYIYYRSDHHWTTDGAYLGYLKLHEQLKGSYSPPGTRDINAGISPFAYQRNEVPGFLGTYYSKYRGVFGDHTDILTYYDIPVASYISGGIGYDSLYDLEKLDVYDKYAMFMRGNEGVAVVESVDDGTDRKDELVLFKDSYSNCLIPFLTFDYDRITVVDLRYFPDSVQELLAQKPDADVLLMYNFMHFNEDNHFYKLVR